MKLISHTRIKQEAEKKIEEDRKKKLEQEPREKIQLEKGDLPAMLIAALFNFILPVMLVLTLICLAAYFLFIRP